MGKQRGAEKEEERTPSSGGVLLPQVCDALAECVPVHQRGIRFKALLQQSECPDVVAAAADALECLPDAVVREARQMLRALPKDAATVCLALCLHRRGGGGRQPGPDPRDDPSITPDQAARILLNRRSAAISKLNSKVAKLAATIQEAGGLEAAVELEEQQSASRRSRPRTASAGGAAASAGGASATGTTSGSRRRGGGAAAADDTCCTSATSATETVGSSRARSTTPAASGRGASNNPASASAQESTPEPAALTPDMLLPSPVVVQQQQQFPMEVDSCNSNQLLLEQLCAAAAAAPAGSSLLAQYTSSCLLAPQERVRSVAPSDDPLWQPPEPAGTRSSLIAPAAGADAAAALARAAEGAMAAAFSAGPGADAGADEQLAAAATAPMHRRGPIRCASVAAGLGVAREPPGAAAAAAAAPTRRRAPTRCASFAYGSAQHSFAGQPLLRLSSSGGVAKPVRQQASTRSAVQAVMGVMEAQQQALQDAQHHLVVQQQQQTLQLPAASTTASGAGSGLQMPVYVGGAGAGAAAVSGAGSALQLPAHSASGSPAGAVSGAGASGFVGLAAPSFVAASDEGGGAAGGAGVWPAAGPLSAPGTLGGNLAASPGDALSVTDHQHTPPGLPPMLFASGMAASVPHAGVPVGPVTWAGAAGVGGGGSSSSFMYTASDAPHNLHPAQQQQQQQQWGVVNEQAGHQQQQQQQQQVMTQMFELHSIGSGPRVGARAGADAACAPTSSAVLAWGPAGVLPQDSTVPAAAGPSWGSAAARPSATPPPAPTWNYDAAAAAAAAATAAAAGAAADAAATASVQPGSSFEFQPLVSDSGVAANVRVGVADTGACLLSDNPRLAASEIDGVLPGASVGALAGDMLAPASGSVLGAAGVPDMLCDTRSTVTATSSHYHTQSVEAAAAGLPMLQTLPGSAPHLQGDDEQTVTGEFDVNWFDDEVVLAIVP